MKGLLLKDFYVLLRQMRVFLLMIIIFAVIPGSNMVIFAVVYAAMMPYTALAYDERSHWEQLAGTMPYSVRDLVVSKYVLGWIFTAAAAAISLLASILERPFLENTAPPAAIGLALCVGLLMIALTLPLMFRFGVERGRMLFILLIVFVACGSAGLVMGIADAPKAQPMLSALCVVLPLAAVLVSPISIALSIRLYRRRMEA